MTIHKQIEEQEYNCKKLWFTALKLYVSDLEIPNSAARFDLFGDCEQVTHLCSMCQLNPTRAIEILRDLHLDVANLYTDNNQIEMVLER